MHTGSPRWWLSVAAAFQTLRENPLHTVLSTLGMIVGVGSLVAILSLGDGMEAFAREQIETTTDLQTINVQTRTTERLGDVTVRRTDVPVLTPRDAAALQTRAGRRRTGGPACERRRGDARGRQRLPHRRARAGDADGRGQDRQPDAGRRTVLHRRRARRQRERRGSRRAARRTAVAGARVGDRTHRAARDRRVRGASAFSAPRPRDRRSPTCRSPRSPRRHRQPPSARRHSPSSPGASRMSPRCAHDSTPG